MKKISKFIAAALLLPLFALTSCNNDNDTPQPDIFSVFATLTAANDNGCSFTAQEKEDSEPTTFTSSRKLDPESVTVGNRYIITYSNGTDKPFKSGSVTLYAIQNVANGKVQEATAAEIDKLTADPITVLSVGRTGTFINIQAQAPIAQTAKVFNLYVDKASLDTESAQIYIGFQSDYNGIEEKQFFGSFDIASVWNDPDIKQVVLHYRTNGAQTTAVYAKGSLSITPAE